MRERGTPAYIAEIERMVGIVRPIIKLVVDSCTNTPTTQCKYMCDMHSSCEAFYWYNLSFSDDIVVSYMEAGEPI